VFGEDAYPMLHLKVAALTQSLVCNHGLVDGNKRLGFAGMRLMYGLNGYTLNARDDEKVELILAVADSRLDTVEKIAERLTTIAVPLTG
jgi:death-on-curing protein